MNDFPDNSVDTTQNNVNFPVDTAVLDVVPSADDGMETIVVMREFGELKVGDVVLSPDGEEVVVTQAYDEHIPESMYQVELWDGATVKVSGNHLWYVETHIDRSYHQLRKKNARNILAKLSSESVKDLYDNATMSDELRSSEYGEIALNEMLALTGYEDDRDMMDVLSRIALSIGHVVEENVEGVSLETGESVSNDLIPLYDAAVFAQQILSLTGKHKYVKRWAPIVGRVISTVEMMELAKTVEVEIPDAPRNAVENISVYH